MLHNARTLCRRTSTQYLTSCLRYYTASVAPTFTGSPMLLKVREDMKTAMRAKDSAKLDVLRGLIAETINAAKTSIPVTTDSQMLKIIQKKIKSSREVIVQFEEAKRADLKEKELAQVQILEEYIQGSGIMSEEDVTVAVQHLIGTMQTENQKTDKGSVMKRLIGPGGPLENQLVDKKDVARVVEGML